MNKLFIPTLRTFLIGAVVLGALLFIPAGTLDYWQAWVFIVVFMISMNATGIYLSLKNPVLLERRMNAGPLAEHRMTQKIFAYFAIIGWVALLVFCGFDHRFGWSSVPPIVSLIGDVLVVLGLFIDFLVLTENSYSASNIQVFEGQKVISTGLYAFIRHPMYAGNVVMVIGVPLALGSWWGLWILPFTIAGLIWRILDEEELLKKDLPGYIEYMEKVRYRLVPYLW